MREKKVRSEPFLCIELICIFTNTEGRIRIDVTFFFFVRWENGQREPMDPLSERGGGGKNSNVYLKGYHMNRLWLMHNRHFLSELLLYGGYPLVIG
jgi:hypothetical protein